MVGRRLVLVFLIIVLIGIPVVSAVEITQDQLAELLKQIPASTSTAPGIYQMSSVDIDKMKTDIVTSVNENNDMNVRSLDGRISQFFQQASTRAIIGLLGVDLLVLGGLFYYLNSTNRKLSYQSVALRRRRDETERVGLVTELNSIRDRLISMEEYNKRMFDTYVIPLENLRGVIDEWRAGQQQQYGRGGPAAPGGYGNQGQAPDEWSGYSQPSPNMEAGYGYGQQESYAGEGLSGGVETQGGTYNEQYDV